jgi:flagellar motor switch protein FliN/FliY
MWLTLRLDIRHAVCRTTACERGSADLKMAQLTEAQIQQTIDQCRDHVGQLAETFRTVLGCEIRLSAGEPSSVGEAGGLADFQVPGLAVGIAVGGEGLIVLIPQTLPLPAWYRQPDISQNDQLQTFAHELSTLLLPADLESERFAAIATENLIEVAQSAKATPSAKMIELSVFHTDGTHEAAVAKLLLIVPVAEPPVTVTQPAEGLGAGALESAEESAQLDEGLADDAEDFDESGDDGSAQAAAATADAALRALRVLNVPVTVSVRLAERKMSLGTVVALVPGSLVTFNKSCEALLDLYVNNHRFCQGEAIKIGESFGLKVSKVDVNEERRERIVEGRGSRD